MDRGAGYGIKALYQYGQVDRGHLLEDIYFDDGG